MCTSSKWRKKRTDFLFWWAMHIEIRGEFSIRYGRWGFVALRSTMSMACLWNPEWQKNASRRPFYNLPAYFPIAFLYCFNVSMRISFHKIKMHFLQHVIFSDSPSFRFAICSSFNLPRIPPPPAIQHLVSKGVSFFFPPLFFSFFYLLNI